METKKISELTEVTSPIATDVFPIVNGGETKKVQLTNVKTVLGIDDVDTRLTTAEGEIDTAQSDINNAEAVIGNETDTYSASSTYALGSLVIYNSLLYKCTTAITVAEAWNSAKWTQVSLTSLANEDNVYSTEEKVIGKWINGKPIYRKVIKFDALSTGSNTFPLNISNLGKIILFNCNAYRSNTDFPIPYLDKSTDGSTTPVTAYLSARINNKTTLEIKDGWGSGITGGYLILEYTKTTD